LIKEISPHLYLARIPLPDSPLLYLNSYIIKGTPRSLIIDTGMNRRECLDAMNAAVSELGIDLPQTDFFITHLHADHIGLVGTLAAQTSRVYFNRFETPELYTPDSWWERLNKFAVIYGFPQIELARLFNQHPASRYRLKTVPEITIVQDGDIIEAGGYSFRCIETPGHSAGHTCLYEASRQLLISGDHILSDITSNIATRFNSGQNALGEYLQSLDKVYPLDVSLVLPGHRNIMTDMQKRIRELKEHHLARAQEQLAILAGGELDAYRVATKMTWDIEYTVWDELPAFQKYFTFAEALAHLQYLESLGKVKARQQPNGKIVYSSS